MAVTSIINNQSNFEITDSGNVFFLSKMAIGTINPVGGLVYIQNIGTSSGDIIIDYTLLTVPIAGSAEELAGILSGYLDTASANGSGWASYVDTQYTVSAKRSIAQGVTIALPNNAGAVINGFLPAGVTSFYDGTKITPANIGDAYTIRIAFTAQNNNVNGLAEINLNIGGAVGEIFRRSIQFPKGAGTVTQYSFAELIYSSDTFKANGGQLDITSITGTTEVWGVVYVIARIHNAG